MIVSIQIYKKKNGAKVDVKMVMAKKVNPVFRVLSDGLCLHYMYTLN